MPTSGRGRSVKRPIQLWSPHSRWLSVLWIEPKKAPRSRLPLVVGQPVGDAVEVLVLPAIVARHALHISAIDHDTLAYHYHRRHARA